ncbi:MAG: thioredoxin domain-containing protein [Sphingomonas sp.]|nr:thioredoxin domain-containing protein [Sphingomonas sp.]
MKRSFAAAALIAVALAGCSKKSDNTATNVVESHGPIAAVPPPPGKQWTDIVSETPEGGYVMGNPNAPVKLVEYASFSCPHCKHFEETGADPLKSKYVATGKVSWEFRSFLIHSMDAPLTLLMRCRGPEPFFALTEQLYAQQDDMMKKFIAMSPAEQQRIAALPPAENFKAQAEIGGLYGFFGARGLPRAQADACLSNQKATDQITAWTNKYAADGITMTPSFVINGTVWESDIGSEIWPQLDQALTRATGG